MEKLIIFSFTNLSAYFLFSYLNFNIFKYPNSLLWYKSLQDTDFCKFYYAYSFIFSYSVHNFSLTASSLFISFNPKLLLLSIYFSSSLFILVVMFSNLLLSLSQNLSYLSYTLSLLFSVFYVLICIFFLCCFSFIFLSSSCLSLVYSFTHDLSY